VAVVTPTDAVLAALAGLGAGFVNAVAGGGTLISFPALVALGVPAVSANVTNTVALCPGYLGGAWAQRRELRDFAHHFRALFGVVLVGALAGAVLLLNTSDDTFEAVVPWLILLACALLATQNRVRARLAHRVVDESQPIPPWGLLAVGLTAVYGGYFGAGIGVMLLAVLGVVFSASLTRLNALKQALQLAINGVAAVWFVFTGPVHWGFAAAVAVGSLIGGSIGGRFAGRIDANVLRAVVVVAGVAIAVSFWR
jgi:uncharacterized membrane protein YfcA